LALKISMRQLSEKEAVEISRTFAFLKIPPE
jgi:hypothetical protein